MVLAALLFATAQPATATVRARATILSPARVTGTGPAAGGPQTTVRTVRDPVTGAPLRVVEYQ